MNILLIKHGYYVCPQLTNHPVTNSQRGVRKAGAHKTFQQKCRERFCVVGVGGPPLSVSTLPLSAHVRPLL